MNRMGRFLIRVSSFLQKEIVDIMRQPRLMLTLVLGPFLILLLFGVGFAAEPREMETVFAISEESPLRATIQEYATTLGPQLVFAGFIEDASEGIRMVENGQVDALVVVPAHIGEMLDSFERPTLTLYHSQINPIQTDYVQIFGTRYVDEVNRRVLQRVIVGTQRRVLDVEQELERTRKSAEALENALDQGNHAAAQRHREELDRSVSRLIWMAGTSLQLYNRLQSLAGGNGEELDPTEMLATIQQNLARINEAVSDEQASDGARRIRQELVALESILAELARVEPIMLVSPFQVRTMSVTPVELGASDYYAPSVIALLLQHLCVTVGGLSIVMEKRMGTMEIFRVAPLSSAEVGLGKYLSLGLFAGVVAAVLTLLTVFALQVPMLGNWALLALVVAVFIFASLGIGFLISLISDTTSQVVQYSMIVLLASVFFSDFFLGLESFQPFVRALSWMLPATYGNQLLRHIMLRGQSGDLSLLLYLALVGVGLAIAVWLLLRRDMRMG